MKLAAGQTAYWLNQELTVREQETVDSDVVEEQCAQRGFLLVAAEVEEGRCRRTIEEYLLGDDGLGAIAEESTVDLQRLSVAHDQVVAQREIELDAEGGVEVESDLTNTDAAIPGGLSMAPYDIPDDPTPVPAFVLHWPTLTPALPEGEAEQGQQWQGKITVQIGAGVFPLAYTVKLLEHVEEDPLMEVCLDEEGRAATVQDVTLHLAPRGSWTVRISHEDGTWQRSEGQVDFTVRATYKEDEEDEEEIDVEVLGWANTFAVERIPVTFDDEEIHLGDWRPAGAAAEDEDEEAPTPPPDDGSDQGDPAASDTEYPI